MQCVGRKKCGHDNFLYFLIKMQFEEMFKCFIWLMKKLSKMTSWIHLTQWEAFFCECHWAIYIWQLGCWLLFTTSCPMINNKINWYQIEILISIRVGWYQTSSSVWPLRQMPTWKLCENINLHPDIHLVPRCCVDILPKVGINSSKTCKISTSLATWPLVGLWRCQLCRESWWM